MSKTKTLKNSLKKFSRAFWFKAWQKSGWRKALTIVTGIIILFVISMYGVAEWYIHDHENQPLTLGTTFVADYATSFGLDPHQTLKAILEPAKDGGLGMKQVRLVGYWSDIEPTQGQYNFSELDDEFALANQYGAKVSLSIGLRQPRWPECHPPDWISGEPTNVWEPQLNSFMTTVINRYKDNPALQNYELENEFFLKAFGQCTNFDRSRLFSEYNMDKKLDPAHPIIVSRSDNWVGIPVGQPIPDESAVSVYKRVWDSNFTHRYFEYPLPPWFYSALAGLEQIYSGKDTFIHELQAEPWTPNGEAVVDTPLPEQFKSMNPTIMQKRIKYGEDTGMRTIDLWGAEWWYWLKVDKHDPSVWNVVQQNVSAANTHNQKLTQK